MKVNKKNLVWCAALVGVQLVILLGFFVQRLYTLRTGREVILATRAVDPRDLVRGQYALLRYEIGSVSPYKLEDEKIIVGDTVYVTVRTNYSEYEFDAIRVSRTPPRDFDIFLRGTVRGFSDDPQRGQVVNIEYGIEKYFIPAATPPDTWQSGKVFVYVRVDRQGNAVIERMARF